MMHVIKSQDRKVVREQTLTCPMFYLRGGPSSLLGACGRVDEDWRGFYRPGRKPISACLYTASINCPHWSKAEDAL